MARDGDGDAPTGRYCSPPALWTSARTIVGARPEERAVPQSEDPAGLGRRWDYSPLEAKRHILRAPIRRLLRVTMQQINFPDGNRSTLLTEICRMTRDTGRQIKLFNWLQFCHPVIYISTESRRPDRDTIESETRLSTHAQNRDRGRSTSPQRW